MDLIETFLGKRKRLKQTNDKTVVRDETNGKHEKCWTAQHTTSGVWQSRDTPTSIHIKTISVLLSTMVGLEARVLGGVSRSERNVYTRMLCPLNLFYA